MEVLINRSPGARRGRGGRACPLPHTRRAGPGQDPRLLCGLPQAAGAAAGRGGCELNLCPLKERCLAVPTPCVLARDPPWRGSCQSWPSCKGARQGLACPPYPGPRVRDSQESLQGRSGKSAGRTLSFRRRNVVSVPLPDSAPGIQLAGCVL